MMYRLGTTVAAVVACLALLCPQTRAQVQGNEPTVESTGVASLDLKPQVLRLQMQIKAAGKDVDTALANLQARQEQVRTKLLTMGAAEGSIKFTKMNVVSEREDRQRQMQRMMMQRMRSGGQAPASQSAASPSKVSVLLKAEWPLTAAEPARMLAMASQMEQKIKAEDLAGKKDMEKLSSADQEALEESEGQPPYGEYGPDQEEGRVLLIYVAKVSKKDQAETLKKAFEKAKAHSEQMVAAAGMKLGAIRQVRSGADSDTSRLREFSAMADGPYAYQMMQQLVAAGANDEDQTEAMAADPGSLKHHAMVTLTFQMVQP